LSSGNFGNLKQKMHLKSSLDNRAAFGLYKLKLLIFMVLSFLFTCTPVGLLLTVRVVVLDFEVVDCRLEEGIDLEE
jgi:hypothetical protein